MNKSWWNQDNSPKDWFFINFSLFRYYSHFIND